MTLSLETIYLWLLIICRCSGLLIGFPFGGENNGIPNTVKALLVGAISYITLTVTPLTITLPNNVFVHFFYAARELLIGLSMGFVIKISFAMLEMAGYLIANEIGLNTSENFNPLTENSSTFSSVLFVQFAIVLFFITDLDKELLSCFVQSYKILDFQTSFQVNHLLKLTNFISNVFVLSLKIAAPLIALNFLVNFGFAILGKAAPKINVFFLSFPLRIFSGICLLSLMLYLIYAHIAVEFNEIPEKMLTIIQP